MRKRVAVKFELRRVRQRDVGLQAALHRMGLAARLFEEEPGRQYEYEGD